MSTTTQQATPKPIILYHNTEQYERDGQTFSRITGTKTLREMEAQIKTVLASIEGGIDYEYLNFYVGDWSGRYDKGYMDKNRFPDGQVLIPARYGNCEGVRVDIFVSDKETGEISLVASIKYFHSIEKVSQIACVLTQAFNEGLYH